MAKTSSAALDTLRTLRPKSAVKFIETLMKAGKVPLILGGAGIGKSDIVHQIAAKQNRQVRDIRLALYDPTDVKGMPYFDSVDKMMKWAQSVEFPSDPNSTDIIFLDELPSAPPAVQAACYQLILNKQIGNYKLPKGVSIVAAGNRTSDRGVVYKIPAPLVNRFCIGTLEVNFEDFFDWSVNNKVHPSVLGFLQTYKNELSNFDPKSASMAFASPRSWKTVSDLLYVCEEDRECTEDHILDLVSGSIGDGLALKFITQRRIHADLPNPTDILNGEPSVAKIKIKEISAKYSISVALCYELSNLYKASKSDTIDESAKKKSVATFNRSLDNFLGWLMNNLEDEFVVMAVTILYQNYKLSGLDFSKSENGKAFLKKYSSMIASAIVY